MFSLPPSFLFPGQIIGWRACALSCTRGDLGIKCCVLWLLSMLLAMGSCFEVWSLGFSKTFRSSYHSQSIHILHPALIGLGPSAVYLPLYQSDQVIVKNAQTFLYHCFPQTLIVCLTSGEFLLWDPAELETSLKNYSCHCVGNEWRNSYIFQNLSYDQYEHAPQTSAGFRFAENQRTGPILLSNYTLVSTNFLQMSPTQARNSFCCPQCDRK